MEERWFIKVGNCYVEFVGLWHKIKMRSDYKKATPFLTKKEAETEANNRRVRNFKAVKKML